MKIDKQRLELVKNAAHYMLYTYNERQIGAYNNAMPYTMATALARRYGVPFDMALEIISPIMEDYLRDSNKFLGCIRQQRHYINWHDYLPA